MTIDKNTVTISMVADKETKGTVRFIEVGNARKNMYFTKEEYAQMGSPKTMTVVATVA